MPSIPKYNQSATEEAGLTRAKKRVIKAMEKGIVKISERPAIDPTGGKSDAYAELVIRQMEDISSLLRQSNLLFEERNDLVLVEDVTDARMALKSIVIVRKLMRRLLRDLRNLSKGISYVDLRIYNDLLSTWNELRGLYELTAVYLTNIDVNENDYKDALAEVERDYGGDSEDDESDASSTEDRRRTTIDAFSKIPDFENLVLSLFKLYEEVSNEINTITRNFNASRQQRVLPAEAVSEVMTGSGSRLPVYRIGNNSLVGLYEIDGLPRYI